MSKRIGSILLWTLGLLALAGSSFVLYNFAFNDWRVDGDFLSSESLRSILGGDDHDDDSTRLVGWEFPLSDSAMVEIDGALCAISILPSTGSISEIRLILSGDAVDTTLYHASSSSPDSTRLVVSAHPTSRWIESSRGVAEIEILVPTGSRIAIRLRTGDVRIDRMSGGVQLEMSDGIFEGTALGGRLAIRNGRGSIRLERSSADGTIELGSGRIDLAFNEGDLRVGAPDGVEARAHFGTLEARTTGGAIVTEIISERPRCRLESDNGMIRLKLLPSAHATIDARSESAIVTHRLPLDSPDSVATTPFSVSSTLNGGGDSVVARTRGGLIFLDAFGERIVSTPRFEIPPADTAVSVDTGSVKGEE